ncbi:MAG: S8 family serine peptidase [Planctomycetota bacterium]
MIDSFRSSFLWGFLGLISLIPAPASLRAQQELPALRLADAVSARTWVENEFLVTFQSRSFDLSELRQAILAGSPPAATDRVVGDYVRRTRADRAPFVHAVEKLGGSVPERFQFWIINSALVRIPEALRPALEAMPNVAFVERNRIFPLQLREATNASNHDTDAVNLMTVGGKKVIGTGGAVSMIDTGSDSLMSTSGRPHALYYPGGNPANRTGGGLSGSRLLAALGIVNPSDVEDNHGHGTATTSCAAGADWTTSTLTDSGSAPGAHIVGMKVAIQSNGSTTTAILAAAWQRTLADRQKYNILAANASYAGSPSMTAGDQRALDSCAFNGNIVCCVPSGNLGTNLSATSATYNGLSVGASDKNSKSPSSFSGRGTIFGKQIPDCLGVGRSVRVAVRDNETAVATMTGTSFSSPLVAGTALLLRQANPRLTALETKALILQTAQSGGPGSGAGFVHAKSAVDAAIKASVLTKQLTRTNPSMTFPLALNTVGFHRVTIAYHRKNFNVASNDDLNLSVIDPNNKVIATSNRAPQNSWEQVSFWSFALGTYKVVVSGNLSLNSTVDFAISGVGDAPKPKLPTLTAINPARVNVFGSPTVTLTGTNLGIIDTVHVGTMTVKPKSSTATTLKFDPPFPSSLGPVTVKVSNSAGTSNGLTLTYQATSPPVALGPSRVSSLMPFIDDAWGGAQHVAIFFFSFSQKSSTIPGLVSFGLGDGFKSLFAYQSLVTDKLGHGSISIRIPPGFGNRTVFFQVVFLDVVTLKTPFPTTNVLSHQILF